MGAHHIICMQSAAGKKHSKTIKAYCTEGIEANTSKNGFLNLSDNFQFSCPRNNKFICFSPLRVVIFGAILKTSHYPSPTWCPWVRFKSHPLDTLLLSFSLGNMPRGPFTLAPTVKKEKQRGNREKCRKS